MTLKDALSKLSTELKIEGKSPKSAKMYLFYVKGHLNYSKKEPSEMTQDDVKAYLAYLMADKGYKASSVGLARSALTFFYDHVLGLNIMRGIKTPKVNRSIPEVLSKGEIVRMQASSDLRTRLFIGFLYGSGLRVAECASLKWSDLDLDENIGTLKEGKGGKDRYFILPDGLLADLEAYRPNSGNEYIFPLGNGYISTRTIQRAIKKAALDAGIRKKVYPHLLRHSFATHLLESGTDIRVIQELLAHSNLQTTQFYTHISKGMLRKVKSPLDS